MQFDAVQKARWDNLVGFGIEALNKKQFHKARLAIDMTPTEPKDWLSYALGRCRPELALDIHASHSEAELGMSYQDILHYVVANIHGYQAVALVRRLEELSPGICAGFRDRRGHNFFWYAASCWQLRSPFAQPYTESGQPRDQSEPGLAKKTWRALTQEHGETSASSAGNRKLLAALIHYGVSPFEANEVGVTFSDLDTYARLLEQRRSFTRLRHDTPGFEDAAFWGFDAQKAR